MNCTGFAFIFAVITCDAPPPTVVCPPVRTWTKQFQKQVAKELASARNTAIGKVVVDAIGDRDIARACADAQAQRK